MKHKYEEKGFAIETPGGIAFMSPDKDDYKQKKKMYGIDKCKHVIDDGIGQGLHCVKCGLLFKRGKNGR